MFTRLMTVTFYVSPLLMAIAWSGIGAPQSGFLSQLYRTVTGSTSGLGNIYSFEGIVFVSVLHFVPLSYLLVSGALAAVAPALEEASHMSRAGRFTTIRKVTIPLIWPTVVAALLQVAIFSAEEFAIPFFLGVSRGFQTLPTEIFSMLALGGADYNRVAAAGTMLLWFTVGGVFLFRRYSKLGDRYAVLAGKAGTAPQPVDLKGWRWLSSGLIGLYLFLSLGAPTLALLWGSLNAYPAPRLTLQNLSLRNWSNTLGSSETASAMANSLLVAGIGATVTVLVCVVVSFVIVRTKNFGRVVADYAASLPMAIPSIVLGMGFLWFYIVTPLPLYGTLLGLGVACAVRFFGYGVRAVNAGLLQVHGELTEAAYMSRASVMRSIRTIVAPLISPTIIGAWVVIFVRFIQELNITILIFSQSSVTVPVLMFLKLNDSLQNAVYPLALILMVVTFLCVHGLNSATAFGTRRRSRANARAARVGERATAGEWRHG